VPWLQEGGQVRLAGSASMDGFVKRTHPWTQVDKLLNAPRMVTVLLDWFIVNCK